MGCWGLQHTYAEWSKFNVKISAFYSAVGLMKMGVDRVHLGLYRAVGLGRMTTDRSKVQYLYTDIVDLENRT